MPEPIKKVGKAIWNVSLYTLSIPERYLRGLTALTGGMLKETTDIVVPDFVPVSYTHLTLPTKA